MRAAPTLHGTTQRPRAADRLCAGGAETLPPGSAAAAGAPRALLLACRLGLLAMPLLPLVHAGWPDWLAWLLPDLCFPAVTARNLVFRGLVQAVFACWVVLAWLDPAYRPRPSGQLALLGAMLAAVAIADLVGPHPFLSVWSTFERMEGLVGLLHVFAFYLVARSVLDRAWWARFAAASAAVAAVVALLAIAQAADMYYGITEPFGLVDHHKAHIATRAFRANICLGSAVLLAGYLVVHVFVAGLVAAAAGGWVRLAVLGGAVAPVFLAMLLTKTRAAQGALVVGAAAWAVARSGGGGGGGRLRRVLVAAAVAAGAIIALSVLSVAWIDDLLGTHRVRQILASAFARAELWRQAFAELVARPWGLGQEAFALTSDGRQGVAIPAADVWFDRPHNVFVRWFADGGAAGGLGFLALVALLWRRLGRVVDAARQRSRAYLAGALAAYAAFHFTQPDDLTSWLVLFSLLAYADAESRWLARPRAVASAAAAAGRGWMAAALAACGVLAAALAFAWVTVPGWRGAAALLDVVRHRYAIDAAARAGERLEPARYAAAAAAARRAPAAAWQSPGEVHREAALLAAALLRDDNAPPSVREEVVAGARRDLAADLAGAHVVGVRLLQQAADLELAAGQAAAAEQLLARAARIAPHSRRVVLGLAQAAWGQRDVDRALDIALSFYRREPQHRDVQALVLVLALEADRLDVVEEVAAALGEAGLLPDDAVREMFGRAGRLDLLRPAYEPVVARGEALVAAGQLPALNLGLVALHARAALALGRRELADAFLEVYEAGWPPAPRRVPRQELVAALWAGGRADWIVRLYEPLVRASDTAVRRGLMAAGEAIPHFVELADAYAALGRRDRAVATLRDAIHLHPEFADAGEARILELQRRR